MAEGKENIVMFPFMAQGHIIPFLALSLKLEQEMGFSITFVTTPQIANKLKLSLPQNSSIRFHEIVPFYDGCETSESLPVDQVIRFIEASVCLKPTFTKILTDLIWDQSGHLVNPPPLCVVTDMFFSWSAEVAHDLGVSHAIFNTTGGYGLAMFHSITLNLPHLHQQSPDDNFQVPGFPEGYTFPGSELPEPLKSGKHSFEFIWKVYEDWRKTDAMLFNTAEEIDRVGLTYFRENFPCRVIPIGPIISNVGSKARAGGEEEAKNTWENCRNWLNKKPSNSVLYVAFGSQNTPSPSQLEQLAMALEASQVDYIWVVRLPSNFLSDDEKDEWMRKWNNGEIEYKKNGLLLHKWAPQIDILSHDSTGAFLSHYEWNSTTEALSNGVLLLAWPLGSEQHFNAKMLEEELMVSLKVASGNSHEVRYEELLKKIQIVMKEDKGKEMRKKALEIKEVIKKNNASSASAMDEFFNVATLARNSMTSSKN